MNLSNKLKCATHLACPSVRRGSAWHILVFASVVLFAQEYTTDVNTVALWHFNEVSGSSVSNASGIETLTGLIFNANTEGKSVIQFTFSCEFVNPDDNPIEIKGLGKRLINVE